MPFHEFQPEPFYVRIDLVHKPRSFGIVPFTEDFNRQFLSPSNQKKQVSAMLTKIPQSRGILLVYIDPKLFRPLSDSDPPLFEAESCSAKLALGKPLIETRGTRFPAESPSREITWPWQGGVHLQSNVR